jgi:hypothetical protein
MPGHQLGILGVPEYTTQAINHGKVPHRQGKNSPLRVTFFLLLMRQDLPRTTLLGGLLL